MADNSPNSTASQSNIDDLVRELSRPQGTPATPSVNPAPTPKPMAQPVVPPTSSPAPTPIPRPVMPSSGPVSASSAPKPNTASTPSPAPTQPLAPKEYQSSIRTMSDDLAKLKSGQMPQGVNVPRKIDNSPAPAKPVAPVAPASSAPKPLATATMPEATRSGSLPSAPKPVVPPTSSPAPTPIPRPVMPSMPEPTKNNTSKIDSKNQFYVPPVATTTTKNVVSSGSRNLVFVAIGVGMVLLGVLYWFFMIKGTNSTPVATSSPAVTFTPRPTITPNLDVLSTVFPNKGGVIVLPDSGDPGVAFANAISAQTSISAGTFTTVGISNGTSSSSLPLTFSGLMNRFLAAYPASLQSSLGNNYKFLLYGQKESFDSKGKPIVNAKPGTRFVIVSEVASSSASIMQTWEPSMSVNLSSIMNVLPGKNTGAFAPTNYNGASIRFKNFPYPDRSIDYSLVQHNGKTYLIIAGSREAMFAAIDAFTIRGK
ncbi:MAG: hypothetical protein KBC81_00935 [Candidatus Pacebacteria bacterium]|nr:hypothetical protein [Candidatus Paceibacterota bacterium]